jgi:hypothetical protein
MGGALLPDSVILRDRLFVLYLGAGMLVSLIK